MSEVVHLDLYVLLNIVYYFVIGVAVVGVFIKIINGFNDDIIIIKTNNMFQCITKYINSGI